MQPVSFLKRHLFLLTRPSTATLEKRQERKSVAPESPKSPSSPKFRTRTRTPSPRSDPKPPPPIKATTTPLHTWDNGKCRSWLYDLCITTLNYTPDEADLKVMEFTGNGRMLYAKDKDYWRVLFGNYNGLGVYSILSRIEPPWPPEADGKVGLFRRLRNSI